MLLEQSDRVHNEIIEIHRVIIPKSLLVLIVDVGDLAGSVVPPGHPGILVRSDQLIFSAGDHAQSSSLL